MPRIKLRRVSTDLEPADYDALYTRAREEERSIAFIVRQAIQEYLERS